MRPRRVCLVGDDLGGLNEQLECGATVHVLWCGTQPVRVPGGVSLRVLDAGQSPPALRVPNLYEPSQADISDQVRLALERLHREHNFDRIEFACRRGLGFRAIQAKRAGLAFADVELAVRLDSCGEWEREAQQRWAEGYDEVERDFLERFAFEHADVRLTPNADVLRFVQERGWKATEEQSQAEVESEPLVTIAIAHFNLGEFLPAMLASLAEQTYRELDVIVIDDGSTDAQSRATFEAMRQQYPLFRFLIQANAGIGATRNRCLDLARGEFFIPVDADNIARPEMVERFVLALQRNPNLDAMTCYFLAFESTPEQPLYAHRPTGGPHALAGIRNVYGDANAIFRTDALRTVGGYETDRGTSCEDWELFVKLVRSGKGIGVVPEHLFYYRQRPGGFSRTTNWFANHQRVMRQFGRPGSLEPADSLVLWNALIGFHQRIIHLEAEQRRRRYRLVDRMYSSISKFAGCFRRRTRNTRDASRSTAPALPPTRGEVTIPVPAT